MKNYILLFSAFILIFVSSCKKDEVISSDVSFTASLSGAEEVPAVTSTASGTFEGIYNKDSKVLTYTITYSGVTPTLWHFHKGAKGTSGGVIFNLGTTFSSPYKGTTVAFTTEQEMDLMNGLYYLNIHSAKSPSGEIRGQLIKK